MRADVLAKVVLFVAGNRIIAPAATDIIQDPIVKLEVPPAIVFIRFEIVPSPNIVGEKSEIAVEAY